MLEDQYNIVFNGVIDGFDPAQVKSQFAALFSLDAAKVEAIFAAQKTTLKSAVSQAVAQQYSARLAAIGVSTVIEPVVAAGVAPLALEPMDEPAAAARSPEQSENQGFARSGLANDLLANRASQAQAAAQERELHFEFFGKGAEYFKIWIVNILLTIVTLGIYSAWAKVRNLQYFYGNTRLNEASFEYTAKPLQILKGRIIAMVFLVAYTVFSQSSPLLALAMLGVLLVFLPWIVVLSLRFNARYTSYRNIHFDFHGGVWDACKAFVLWPIAGMLTFGILMPFAWKKQTEYIVGNHSYGTTGFSFTVEVGEYFKLLLTLIGAGVIFAVLFGIFVGGSIFIGGPMVVLSMTLLYLAFALIVGAYFAVTMANIQYNHTSLDDHRFSANWQTPSYLKLQVVNTLLILVTLGLFIPFAKVRMAAYKAEHTQFIACGDLDSFIAGEKNASNSLAEGVNDLFAMDISI